MREFRVDENSSKSRSYVQKKSSFKNSFQNFVIFRFLIDPDEKKLMELNGSEILLGSE